MFSSVVRRTGSFFPTIPETTLFSEFLRVIFIRIGNGKVTDSALPFFSEIAEFSSGKEDIVAKTNQKQESRHRKRNI